MTSPARPGIAEVLLVEDDPGDVLLTKEAAQDSRRGVPGVLRAGRAVMSSSARQRMRGNSPHTGGMVPGHHAGDHAGGHRADGATSFDSASDLSPLFTFW
jgi:hypothetical protein